MKRFGNNGAVDEYEAFAAVRHTGTLAEFVAAFEARLALVPNLAYHQYLGFFMAGLRHEVRTQMKAAKITNYTDAVQFVLDVDQVAGNPPAQSQSPLGTFQPVSQAPTYGRSFKKGPPSSNSSNSVTGPFRNSQRNFREMSSEEYKRHLAAGTCFKCCLKYGPTHRCPPKTLNVLVYEEEDLLDDMTPDEKEAVEAEIELRLSELSFNGLDTSETMKLFGSLNNHDLLVMVDSGASHCFVSDKVVAQLQLQVTPTAPYSVRLGDGSLVRAEGICRDIPLLLASEVFVVPCYVFPLRNIDIILGVSWLKSLGDVTANWDNLSMKFPFNGRLVILQGDPTLTRRECSARDIHALESGEEGWVLCSLTSPAEPNFDFADNLTDAARRQLHDLTAEFPAVMNPTTTLPPSRRIDHKFHFSQGHSLSPFILTDTTTYKRTKCSGWS